MRKVLCAIALIFDKAFDIGKRNPNGNIDIPRMREGGLRPRTGRQGAAGHARQDRSANGG